MSGKRVSEMTGDEIRQMAGTEIPVPCYYCNMLVSHDRAGLTVATAPDVAEPWKCPASSLGHLIAAKPIRVTDLAEVYADLQQLIKDYSDGERDVIAAMPFTASLDQLFAEKYGMQLP